MATATQASSFTLSYLILHYIILPDLVFSRSGTGTGLAGGEDVVYKAPLFASDEPHPQLSCLEKYCMSSRKAGDDDHRPTPLLQIASFFVTGVYVGFQSYLIYILSCPILSYPNWYPKQVQPYT